VIIPGTSRNGANSAMNVTVAARMAPPTSRVPASATAATGSPRRSPRRRVMFSTTMIEVSGSTPMATTSPPSEKMFSEKPASRITKKFTSSAKGSAMAMMSTWRGLPRNRNSTSTTSASASRAVLRTPFIESTM